MKLQAIQDSKGNATGVFIPINEWKELKKQYSELEAMEYEEPTKEAVLKNIKAGLEEVKLFKNGKLKTTSAKDFLNKL